MNTPNVDQPSPTHSQTTDNPQPPDDELAVHDSVSDWLDRVRQSSEAGAAKLWNHFLLKLTELACSKLTTAPKRAADEEDVVLATVEAYFRALRAGSVDPTCRY